MHVWASQNEQLQQEPESQCTESLWQFVAVVAGEQPVAVPAGQRGDTIAYAGRTCGREISDLKEGGAGCECLHLGVGTCSPARVGVRGSRGSGLRFGTRA